MRLLQLPIFVTCLAGAAGASAEPVEIGADKRSAPLRTDPGTGLCVTAIHVGADGILTNTSEATVRLDLGVGDAGIDGKVTGQRLRALNLRNADAASTGDHTGPGTEETFFPFSNDPAATPQGNDKNLALRGRSLLAVPKEGLFTFGVNSEAGFRLTIGGLLVSRSPSNMSGHFSQQVRFAAPGLYAIEVTNFVGTGPKGVFELSLAEGAQPEVAGDMNAFGAAYKLVPPTSFYTAVVNDNACLECQNDAGCAPGSFCGDQKLCQLCLLDTRCGATCAPCAGATPFCSSGQCVACTQDRDQACTAQKQVCKPLTSTCGPCTNSLECKGQICRGDGTCGPCSADNECPDNQLCDAPNGLCYVRVCSESNRAPCSDKGQVCNLERGVCEGCKSDDECQLVSPTLQCNLGVQRCQPRRDLRYQGGCSVSEGRGASFGLLGMVGLCLLLLAAGSRFWALGARRRRRAVPAQRPRAARRRPPQGLGPALILAGLLGAAARPAAAQIAVNAQTFRPAVGVQNLVTLDGSRTPEALAPAANVVFDFAFRPLRLFDATAGFAVADTVGLMATAHVQLGLGLTRFFFLGASLPVVAFQRFDSGTLIVDPRAAAPGAFGVGDLRVVAKLRILNNTDHGVGLAFAPQVSFPTGRGVEFRGDDAFGIEPRVVLDYKFRQGTFIALNAGFQARTADQVILDNRSTEPSTILRISHQVRYGVGLFVPIGKGLGLGGEVAGGATFTPADNGSLYTPLEGAAVARWTHRSGLGVSVGGGGAFISAPGIPLFRAFASIGYLPLGRPGRRPRPEPEPPPPAAGDDPDHDGVTGAADGCPTAAGPEENKGCPYVDTDKDGMLDNTDLCPQEAGPLAYRGCPEGKADRDKDGVLDKNDICPDEVGAAATNGCPPQQKAPELDGDKDGVLDKDDRCPTEAGVADNGGCPDPDEDKDGVVDRLDKCPKEAGPKDAGGCPAAPAAPVIGDDGTFKLATPIRFAPDGAEPDAASKAAITALARLVEGDATIKKLKIAVPASGDKKAAKKLAGKRAKALVAALVEAGVPKKKLAVKAGNGLEGDVIDQVTAVKGKAKKGKKAKG